MADVIERLVSFLDRWTRQAFSPPSPPTPPPPPTNPAPRVDAFPEAVDRLLELEGGYVNDPSDSGGETNFGITQRSYPDLDIRGLTREKAKAIYYTDWWLKYRLGQLPPTIGIKMLDACVNMGARQGTKLLQRALVSQGQDIAVDGKIGPATIAACKMVDEAALLQALRDQLVAFYEQLVAAKPQDEKFLHGWLNRAQV